LRFDLPVKRRRGAMVIVRQALASTGFHQIAGGSFAEQMPMNAGIGIVQLLNAIPGECSATQRILHHVALPRGDSTKYKSSGTVYP